MTFAYGLMLLFELADREDGRFQATAGPWHVRFTMAAELPLREAEMTMNLHCGICGASRHIVPPPPTRECRARGLSTRDIA